MLVEKYNACSSELCNFLHSPVILFLLAPDIYVLYSQTSLTSAPLSRLETRFHNHTFLPVAVYDGCGIVAFVYWLRLKQYL